MFHSQELPVLPVLPYEIFEHIIRYTGCCDSCGLPTGDLKDDGKTFRVVTGLRSTCEACRHGRRWDRTTQTGYAYIERLIGGQIYRSWKYLHEGRFVGTVKELRRRDPERFQKRCSHRRPPTTLQVVGYTEYGEDRVAYVPSPGRRHDPRKCDRSCAEKCRRYVDALKRRPRRRTARTQASA